MNMKCLTTVLIMFLQRLLTGTTQHIPSPCSLEGEHSFLECPLHSLLIANTSQSTRYAVDWFKKSDANGNIKLTTGTSRRHVFNGSALEFWPAEVSDTGKYVCHDGNFPSEDLIFNVLQKNKDSCFSTLCTHNTPISRGTAFKIDCGMVRNYRHNFSIVWYKDCNVYRANVLELYFNEFQDRDSGHYTCVITLMHEGKEYNHTITRHLQITDYEELAQPRILGDDAMNYVDIAIGQSKILNCTAFTGYSNKTNGPPPYWLQINASDHRTFVNECDNDEVHNILCETRPTKTFSEGRMYWKIQLHIRNVKEEHFEYNYTCVLNNQMKLQNRTFRLKKTEKTMDIPKHVFTTGIIMAIVSSIVLLVIAGVCLVFRIEITLTYRSLTGKDETISDGKEYDAYVSYLRYSMLGDEEERKFALDILSQTLENHFGYDLCIFDRDVMPGGAIVDDISSYIDKSRRLIIILSKKYLTDSAMHELESGLYKSLVERKIKVILIEYNLPKDFKLIPESLHLLKSSSKIKWKEEKSLPLNSRFWKKMRYLLPAKPIRNSVSTVSDTLVLSKKMKK